MLILGLVILALVVVVVFFFPKFMYERRAGMQTPMEAYSMKCIGFKQTYQKGDGGTVKHYCFGIVYGTAATEEKAIGEIAMSEDGSLTIDLYTGGGGQTQVEVGVGDKDYEMWITHVGGLSKGETKLVPPFPR